MEATAPQGKARVWLQPKYGLVLKMEFTPPGGTTTTMMEIQSVSFAPPPTDGDRIAAETGGHAADFELAMQGPASGDSCAVIFHGVRAVRMTPVTSGFQLALDRTVDADHMGSDTIGLGEVGHSTFRGGGLDEVTGRLQNGMMRIESPPPQFDIETAFGKAGSCSGFLYRKCFGPQTALPYVLQNPDRHSDGADWLWVKSDRHATRRPHGSAGRQSVAAGQKCQVDLRNPFDRVSIEKARLIAPTPHGILGNLPQRIGAPEDAGAYDAAIAGNPRLDGDHTAHLELPGSGGIRRWRHAQYSAALDDAPWRRKGSSGNRKEDRGTAGDRQRQRLPDGRLAGQLPHRNRGRHALRVSHSQQASQDRNAKEGRQSTNHASFRHKHPQVQDLFNQ